MNTFFNDGFLPIIQKYITELRSEKKKIFYTVDLIRKLRGHYYSDETSGYESINANIGKFLYKYRIVLGIAVKLPNQCVKDDFGNLSHSYLWEFV